MVESTGLLMLLDRLLLDRAVWFFREHFQVLPHFTTKFYFFLFASFHCFVLHTLQYENFGISQLLSPTWGKWPWVDRAGWSLALNSPPPPAPLGHIYSVISFGLQRWVCIHSNNLHVHLFIYDVSKHTGNHEMKSWRSVISLWGWSPAMYLIYFILLTS